MKRLMGAVVVVASMALTTGSAVAKDYASTALNVVPSGQYGAIPPPAGADSQALLYDGLTPLFDDVDTGDLTTYFKSEALGVGTDGPTTPEPTPNPNVSIVRDAYGVPHVRADKPEDGIWAAGWLLAKDRALLLSLARYNARVDAVDVPGLSGIGLLTGLKSFEPSEKTEEVVSRQTKVLNKAGKQGKKLLRDIDSFLAGINAYLEANSPTTEPWARNDIYALNALKGQFLGEGGGDEARRSQFLDGLQSDFGNRNGMKVFNDLRQFRNKEAPTSVDGKFGYGRIPKKAPGSVVVDSGSYEATPAIASQAKAERLSTSPVDNASNTLQINADHSATGNPLMVGGPQIGYFYPGFTYEINMKAGKLRWRGVTSAPFPGYLLIGRGSDFAVTLTSASADIIDQYAEKLCGGSDTKYRYRGKCRDMKEFDAGMLDGEQVSFMRTRHGPVVGYATVNGKRVAISEKRSSYGQDTLDQLFFRRLSFGAVRNPKSFFRAASKTPQTFNSFYMDDEHNAMYTSGLLPKRPKGTDPGLPTKGTGKWEWDGYLKNKKHPQGVDPRDGTLTNWNNTSVRGFGAADDQWGRSGSAARVDLLDKNLKRLANGGKWDLAAVTAAMNAAATQDVRAIDTVPLLVELLKGSQAPNQQAQDMLDQLADWRQQQGSRLDVDLNGEIDHPGAAVMDGAWNRIANAFMGGRLSEPRLDELNTLFRRFDQPPSGQYSGWYQYFDRDIRALLGKKVRSPLNQSYCGKGDLERCQQAIWDAIAAAGAQLQIDQGSANPADWHADATAERITFAPLGLFPMRYTNRPSGIQQVISFDGGRE